jgi:hypothetical protein
VGTIATLHLDATGITGIGQTDGTVYQGTQGTSQPFNASLDSMNFDTTFNLIPQDLGDSSLSPACSLQPTFQVQIYYLEMGVSGISASLIN